MNKHNLEILPAPPQLLRTLVAGFDAVTNHIYLILIPIGLDLLIWLSPRLRLKELIDGVIGDLISQSVAIAPDLESQGVFSSAQELWTLVGERFNLLVGLRSFPVGIPSLMSSLLPVETPLGKPVFIEVDSVFNGIGFFILFNLLGLVLGTIFYKAVARAVVNPENEWQEMIRDWPWLSMQVIILALVWLAIFVGVSIPASCLISLAAMGNMAFGQCAVLIYAGLLIWIIFPLLFSAHGIFINHQKVWPSIKRGVHITRLTLPTTSLFFIIALLLTQLLDILWRIPPEDSWLMMIGLAGHAFIATGVLSASFKYYRDADLWICDLESSSIEETSVG